MTLSEAWVDFIAGWASGAVSVLAIQPVDTVLTRFQAATAATVSATNTLQDTRTLVHRNGFQSLWRGSSAMITAVPMQNAMLMGGYGIGKQWAEDHQKSNIYTSVFIGGCVGGIAQSFLMSPVELIKVNQQVHVSKSAKEVGMELVHGFRVMATTGAAAASSSGSSWRGLNATLLRDGIPHGVWFASYEWCKTEMTKALCPNKDSETATKTTTSAHEQLTIPLVSGAIAATVAWGVGYPADIIKTRIQATQTTKGIWATGVELIAEANGNVFQGLYRGFGLKLMRSIPASMIGFTTYEFVASQLRK